MILEWHPPEDYESPVVYYIRNRDETTGLQILGEYPYKGRYEVAFKLTSTEFSNGKLNVVNYHLDDMILDTLIPAIVEGQQMTVRDRLKYLRAKEEAEEKDKDAKMDEIIRYAGKRTMLPSQIEDRERLIQMQMGKLLKTFGRVQPGMNLTKGRVM